MWHQAESNAIILASLNECGWRNNNNALEIVWDTDENIKSIQDKVKLLINGCGYKSGCTTRRCGCKKKGQVCGAGCHCANCENTEIHCYVRRR